MMPRDLWVGTSWKMNKTISQSIDYAVTLRDRARDGRWDRLNPFIMPTYTAIGAVAAVLKESSVQVGAQNAHWESSGAWTGEVSMSQVADAGGKLVEIGHAERRRWFGETDEYVNMKVLAAIRCGLTPVVCIGESSDIHDNGKAADFVLKQVTADLRDVSDQSQVLLAYEPEWAIGEEGRELEPDDVSQVLEALSAAFDVRGTIVGGSVTIRTIDTLIGLPNLSGFFIGRAAWEVDSYCDILEHVSELTSRIDDREESRWRVSETA